MKKILMILVMGVLVTKINCYSQDYSFPKNNEGEDEFSEVITTNISKDAMFANAQEWIAKTFGDYKSVIQFENKDEGKLIIKGISNVGYKTSSTKEKIFYIVTIECKENRYKYSISDIDIKAYGDIIGVKMEYSKAHDDNIKYIKESDNNIRICINNIDSLNNLPKQTKKIQEQIIEQENIKKRYEEEVIKYKNFYIFEYETINQLIESLKKSMQINNNW